MTSDSQTKQTETSKNNNNHNKNENNHNTPTSDQSSFNQNNNNHRNSNNNNINNTKVMEKLLRDAAQVVNEHAKDKILMRHYFEYCDGILILTTMEFAYGISLQGGNGILIKHNRESKTWGAPCAVRLSGFGTGFYAGLVKKDMVVFLRQGQLKTMAEASNFDIRLGGQTTISIIKGYEGDGYFNVSDAPRACLSSAYTNTRGIALGVSLQGNALFPWRNANQEFYGSSSSTDVNPKSIIMNDNVPIPSAYQNDPQSALNELYLALQHAEDPRYFPNQ